MCHFKNVHLLSRLASVFLSTTVWQRRIYCFENQLCKVTRLLNPDGKLHLDTWRFKEMAWITTIPREEELIQSYVWQFRNRTNNRVLPFCGAVWTCFVRWALEFTRLETAEGGGSKSFSSILASLTNIQDVPSRTILLSTFKVIILHTHIHTCTKKPKQTLHATYKHLAM